jgi:predicted lipoprotein with Yx(FWY)xxD motif
VRTLAPKVSTLYLALPAVVAGSMLAAGPVAADAGRPIARTAKAPTVKLVKTRLGKILVDGAGFTLYMFTHDRRNQDRCVQESGCLGIWPALTASGKPTGGPGVRTKLLGTIKVRGVGRQVTYAGHPLYTYLFDSGHHSTYYVGVNEYNGRWYAVNAAGKAVK